MTGKAIVAGDGHAIAEHAKFIANSAVQDLKAAGGVLKQQAQAARARLMQRRR